MSTREHLLRRAQQQLSTARAFIRGQRPAVLLGACAGIGIILVSATSGSEETKMIIRREGIPDFKNASILGNPGQAILRGEERQFTQSQRELLEAQKNIRGELEKLRAELQAATQIRPDASISPTPTPPGLPSVTGMTQVQLGDPSEQYGPTAVDTAKSTRAAPARPGFGLHTEVRPRAGRPGANTVSFPVKSTGRAFLREPGVILPSGSYVKAKLLTGVEAPEGKSYPVLLQLDFAYIIPNHKRLDLAGCFLIAKAQGDLSTERVQMQATKLSCVSKRGGMFEREVNGFVADDADNSFAVIGNVNTKQDRVAATAFLSSIVAGIGKAIQQAQTTQQTTPLGGAQAVITGDQAKYIGAGGASEAATLVTQWYLKQAQNLLPTINIGSGQDVWVIMQDQVDLPRDYFNHNHSEGAVHASIYSHFTRLVE
jgi:hypothetical protein